MGVISATATGHTEKFTLLIWISKFTIFLLNKNPICEHKTPLECRIIISIIIQLTVKKIRSKIVVQVYFQDFISGGGDSYSSLSI